MLLSTRELRIKDQACRRCLSACWPSCAISPAPLRQGKSAYPLFRQLAYFRGRICKNVNGIRNYQENALKTRFRNCRNNALQNGHIFIDKVQTALSWILIGASRYYRYAGIGEIAIVASKDFHLLGKWYSVRNIFGFPDSLVIIDVNQDYFGKKFAQHQRVGCCCAHEPAADNCRFSRIWLHQHVPLRFETPAGRPNRPAPRTPGGASDAGARRKALKGFAASLVAAMPYTTIAAGLPWRPGLRVTSPFIMALTGQTSMQSIQPTHLSRSKDGRRFCAFQMMAW